MTDFCSLYTSTHEKWVSVKEGLSQHVALTEDTVRAWPQKETCPLYRTLETIISGPSEFILSVSYCLNDLHPSHYLALQGLTRLILILSSKAER